MSNPPEHGHCVNCGDPVALNDDFCSSACSDEYSADVKEARRLDNKLYILMGAGVAAAAVVAFLIKAFLL
jgi:predicted nucleic acid-binding Zn ribbon protein